MSDIEAEKIVFLTYLSRSGSTYLASKLNEIEGIGVGIEAEFIDGWITPGFEITSSAQLESYLDFLYTDYKFCRWKVDRRDLEVRLAQYDFPVLFSQLLASALSLYFADTSYSVILHKGGHYYRVVDEIRKEMPEAKFLFIDRDPRAIFSSMSRSIDSRTGKPMLQDILHFVFGYIDTQERLEHLQTLSYFHLLRYEELLVNEVIVLDAVIQFLGCEKKRKKNTKGYFETVPDEQKHLHQNVSGGKPVMQRIDGWKKELSAADIRFLEIVLSRQLRKNQYTLSNITPGRFKEKIQLWGNLVRYGYESRKRRILRLAHKY